MSDTRMDAQNTLLQAFLEQNAAAFADFAQSFNRDHITEYVLNFECTQFPLGKTKKTLTFIANAYKIHRLNTNNTVTCEHVISIIISSNNLAETAQWSVRAEKELKLSLVVKMLVFELSLVKPLMMEWVVEKIWMLLLVLLQDFHKKICLMFCLCVVTKKESIGTWLSS